MKRRTLAMLLALVMMFGLVACGGNTGNDTGDDNTGDNGNTGDVEDNTEVGDVTDGNDGIALPVIPAPPAADTEPEADGESAGE